MSHPFNRYRNWEEEANPDLRDYERRQYEHEEEYWRRIDREIEREYFREEDE